MPDIYETMIRMPREMEGQLKRLAAKNERSIAATLRFLIREAVERELDEESAIEPERELIC